MTDSSRTVLLTDLVVLGRACPEPLKDGRVTVCLGGWSRQLGFVRLYPTRPNMPWKRWDIIKIEVERNERDTRLESWKIVGSKGEWDTLADKGEKVGEIKDRTQRRNLVGHLTDTCVNVLNQERRSLGIIRPQPDSLRGYFRDNPLYHQTWQQGLPGFTELDEYQVKRDFPQEPRLQYTCPECLTKAGQHDQQVLEWGVYEWVRKHPDKADQVWENLRLTHPNTDIYLLVGNQAAHRNSFMVISVLRVPAGPITRSMFDDYRKTPPSTQ